VTQVAVSLQQRRARRVLLLIGGIPVAMMLSATVLWWGVQTGHVDVLGQLGTANHGELITPPRSVAEITFQRDGVADLLWRDLPPKWRMVIVQRGQTCDEACQLQLYQTRQIHIALGKDFNRVGRVVMSDTPSAEVKVLSVTGPDKQPPVQPATAFAEWIALEHKGLTTLTLAEPALDTLSPETLHRPDQWYLVDPAGWIMMRFSGDLHYKDVISDLRFLLKNSSG
jgi:hypothetical protein